MIEDTARPKYDWSLLEESHSRKPDVWHSYRVEGTGAGGAADFLLAIDKEGCRHLLIPATADLRLSPTRGPLSLSIGPYDFSRADGPSHAGRFLDVACTLRHLNRQFEPVVADVIAESTGLPNPAATAIGTVGNWRRLFATLAGAETLGHQEQLALFGELAVLELLAGARGEIRPEWWTGPDNEPHDFELPEASIEVKARGEESTTITVHGLRQLAETDGKPLYLASVLVAEDSGGRQLDELLQELCSTCPQAVALRQKAAMAGIGRGTQEYARFSVRSLEIGQVDDGFPRITSASLGADDADAVLSLRYELDYRRIQPHLDLDGFTAIQEVLA